MIFRKLTRDEFQDFFKDEVHANFMQSIERYELRKKMGYGAEILGVEDKDKIIAAGLMVGKNEETWFQIGPLLDYTNTELLEFFIKGAKDYCKKNKISRLEFYPPVLLSIRKVDGEAIKSFDQDKIFEVFNKNGFSHMGMTKKLDFKALRWMFVKNLDGFRDMRDVELSFNASTRKKYHQTQRNLYIHVVEKKEELKEWIKPLQESDSKNRLLTRNLKYFEDIFEIFGEKASFVEARVKGTDEIVSSELDIWSRNESVAFLAGTMQGLKKKNGIVAIKGWQLEECLKRKQKRANFYGVNGDFSGTDPLIYAKSGFSGEIEEYIGGFKIMLNPIRFYMDKIMRKMRLKR